MFERLDWQPFEEDTAREAFSQLVDAPAEALAPFDITGVMARLPFYRAWRVIRLDATHRDGDTELEPVYGLWRTGRFALLLDGDSAPIHEVNEDESLKLREPRIADYIRWFLSVLRVDEQAFILFEEAPATVAEADKAAAAHAKPLTAKGRADDGAYLYDATVIYQGALFNATFAVLADGEITMVDDNPLMVDFPASLTPDVPWLGVGFLLRAHLAAAQGAGETGSGTAAGTAPRTGAHRDQPPGKLPGRAKRSRGLIGRSGAARVVDLGGASVDLATGQVVMTPLRGGKAGARPPRATGARGQGRRSTGGKAAGARVPSVRSGRPVILELVELLLERALAITVARTGCWATSTPRCPRPTAAQAVRRIVGELVAGRDRRDQHPVRRGDRSAEIVNGLLPPTVGCRVHRAHDRRSTGTGRRSVDRFSPAGARGRAWS